MKTIAIIFWSLLLSLLWATASFADAPTTDSALDHVAQRSVHARMVGAPTNQTLFDTCDAAADCADHVEHSCQSCLFTQDHVLTNGRGGRQFIETGHIVLAALGYAQDILDPPRV